jgi:hypothetical protein
MQTNGKPDMKLQRQKMVLLRPVSRIVAPAAPPMSAADARYVLSRWHENCFSSKFAFGSTLFGRF